MVDDVEGIARGVAVKVGQVGEHVAGAEEHRDNSRGSVVASEVEGGLAAKHAPAGGAELL